MLLSKEIVARDKSIFRDDGLIFPPRSDGDASLRPTLEQQQPPGPHDTTYDYRQICGPDEQHFQGFMRKVGQALAVSHFGLPNDRDWRLAALPRNYVYIMRYKKPYDPAHPDKVRHDMYLYGYSNQFRSTFEFLPHLEWLLLDPQLKKANCMCKYCEGGDHWKRLGDKAKATIHGQPRGDHDSKPKREKRESTSPPTTTNSPTASKQCTMVKAKRQKVAIGRTGTRTENTFDIRVQQSLRVLAGIPLMSNADRDRDLGMVERSAKSGHEGFREGEYVFYTLQKRVVDATETSKTIVKWPAFIQETTFEAIVQPQSPNATAADFHLTGRVTQVRKYKILLLGSNEELCVNEDCLTPGLANVIDKLGDEKGDTDKSKRMEQLRQSLPYEQETLKLEVDQPRASFERIQMAYDKIMAAYAEIRCHYTTTDSFKREGDNEMPKPVEPFSHDVEENEVMMADSSQRIDPSSPCPVHRPSAVYETGTGLLNDTNKYWQGLFLGFERIWVGDLVRLRLTPHDAKDTIGALKKAKKLARFGDTTDPDLSKPFVMRIKAIYRAKSVRACETDDGVRIAGDLFRVVECPERRQSSSSSASGDESMSTEGSDSSDASKETESADSSVEGDEEAASVNQSKSQASFPIIARPLLEATPEGKLPETQRLPTGYGFQRVNQSSTEVVFCVQHVAGRLYCPLAHRLETTLAANDASFSSLCTLVTDHLEQPTEFDENSSDVQRSYLSLAGLLSGCVKSMGVHTYMGRCFNRRAFELLAIEHADRVEERVLKQVEQQARQRVDSNKQPDQPIPPGWSWVWSKSQSKFYMRDTDGKGHWKVPLSMQ